MVMAVMVVVRDGGGCDSGGDQSFVGGIRGLDWIFWDVAANDSWFVEGG